MNLENIFYPLNIITFNKKTVTMKKIIVLFAVTVFCFQGFCQGSYTFESAVYIHDVEVSKIKRFVELYKKFTDMSLSENRKMTGHWLFRHWYGSGHTFVIYSQYNTMEDYHTDSDLAGKNIKAKIAAIEDEEEKEALEKEWKELGAFWDGHTDEIRAVPTKNGFVTVEDVDFDLPFVLAVSNYNASGDWSVLGNAFFDWAIQPEIDSGSSIAGGVSYHYMGTGREVEVWQAYKSLVDFAKAVSGDRVEQNEEARKAFWSNVEGSHEDQIYLHIGHVDLDKGIFDLAGTDK